jgi:hypothetical protein
MRFFFKFGGGISFKMQLSFSLCIFAILLPLPSLLQNISGIGQLFLCFLGGLYQPYNIKSNYLTID